MSDGQLTLPVAIVTKADAGRLLREVSAVDEFMDATAIRSPGTPMALPKTSRLMAEIVEVNKLNMLVAEDRANLITYVTHVREKAPEIHISFSAEPSAAFMQKITTYLRENIHPQILLQVGLQPTIGAGFMLRTTNKYYDFSMRTTLKAKRDVLMQNIRAAQAEPELQTAEVTPT
ncbi:hypothetical protein H0X10_02970 [Candidatus Saccharibacteria bacterium]|nr:hypothetical protein [Candidatus Saccharibacteria bacterium]